MSAGTSAVKAVKIPHQITPPVRTRRATKSIGQVAAERLKQSVACHQRAENSSQLHICQMIGVNNRSARNGDVDSVKIRHGAENKQPEHEKPAHPACASRGHHGRSDTPTA